MFRGIKAHLFGGIDIDFCFYILLDRCHINDASRVRQQAYAKDPPGSIDIDWSDWAAIWAKDNRYLSYLNAEKFSDLKNSKRYIELSLHSK